MASLILTDKILKKISNGIKNFELRRNIMKKLDISRSCFTKGANRAVKEGYLTERQRKKWQDEMGRTVYDRKVERHGEEKARKMCSDAWEKGMGSDMKRFRKISSDGGKATQEKHKKTVGKNLKYIRYMYTHQYYYDKIPFASKKERFTGAMLKAFGVIGKIIPGKNYQVKFGSKTVDFLFKEPNSEDEKPDMIALEFHSIPKNLGRYKTIEEYVAGREDELEKEGFPKTGKIRAISKIIELYDLFMHWGYDVSKYWEIQRKVREEIAKEDVKKVDLVKGKTRRIGKKTFYFIERIFPLGNIVPEKMTGMKNNIDIMKRIKFNNEISPENIKALDIETCGLGHKNQLFLIGTARCNHKNIVYHGYFARNYSEEKAIIEYFSSKINDSDIYVTYNGDSFDMPFLKARARSNKTELEKIVQHVDVLPLYRKSRRINLASYSLKTVEKILLNFKRTEEVKAAEIGPIYHHYVHTKDAKRINKVIERNFDDLCSTLKALYYYVEKHNRKG
jgi:uncharacterized protein YprB with RNaseH-like and TPR domain